MAQVIKTLPQACATYQKFLDTEAAPKTKKNYGEQLERYMRFRNVTTHDGLLYKDAPANTQEYTLVELRDQIEAFILHLKAQGLRRSSVLTPLWALKFFYSEALGIPGLPWGYLSKRAPRNPATLTKPQGYTKEQMRAMRQYGDLRVNCVVSFLSSTAVRAGAFDVEIDAKTGKVLYPGLQVKHLHKIAHLLPADEPAYNTVRNYGGYLVQVYAGTDDEYFTFTTPEAAADIDAYLAYRAANGETITPESPIIRETFDPANKETAPNPHGMGVRGLSAMCRVLQIRIGMRPADAGADVPQSQFCRIRHSTKAAHGFRMFADTVFMNSQPKVDADFRKLLMGHNTGLQENYYDYRQPESVRAALAQYLLAVNDLTISTEAKLQVQNVQMKQQLQEQKVQLQQADAILQAMKGIPDSVMQQLLAAASKK